LDNNELKKHTEAEVEKRLANIYQKKLEHTEEIEDIDKKWKHIVKQKTNQLEIKHEDEIAELTNEWQNERKVGF
jgi:ABC-type enterochelin transport system substrate-binding protein